MSTSTTGAHGSLTGARPRLITFDTYGTLIDWDGALRPWFAAQLAAKGVSEDPAWFHRRWYYDHALPALGESYVPYRQLLKASYQRALDAVGAPVRPTDGDDLGDVMCEAEPFADSVEILAGLAASCHLATISNSQDDIIEHAVRKLGHPFTYVLTAESTRAYKPHPALFERVLSLAGVASTEALHVAQSQYVDLPRSIPMRIRTVWINRQGQRLLPAHPRPHAELPDLRGLPDLLRRLDTSPSARFPDGPRDGSSDDAGRPSPHATTTSVSRKVDL